MIRQSRRGWENSQITLKSDLKRQRDMTALMSKKCSSRSCLGLKVRGGICFPGAGLL